MNKKDKKKKIILPIALIVFVIAVVGIALQPNFLQIGDKVISDTYYDTAYEAYNNDDCDFNIKGEITTININSNYAYWIAYTTDKMLVTAKMAKQDGKYFSLGDAGFSSEKTLANNQAKLEDSDTLGDDTINYIIVSKDKYENSDLPKGNYHTDTFEFNKTSYVFVYEVVPG
jgi:hypothetical protein